jgi:hypothetical protein
MYHEVVDGLRSFVEALDQRKSPRIEMLAAKYAALCDDANSRLTQCTQLIASGRRAEAIQLAEADPKLLDMVGALDFPGREAWLELASIYDLPPPSPLRIDDAAALNAAFAAQAPLESLLAQHRRLALARAPIEQRLATAREIARLDPEPTSWDDELRSYERAWYDVCLQRSREHAGAKKTRQVLATLMELQTAPHIERPPPKLVQDVQKLVRASAVAESGTVVDELERLQNAGDVDGVRKHILRWREIRELSGGEINAEVILRANGVEAWLEGHDRFVAAERKFEEATAELSALLMKPDATLAEFEEAFQRTVGSTRPPPTDILQAIQARITKLRRQRREQRTLIGIGAGAVVLLIVGSVTFAHYRSVANRNAKSLSDEVKSLLAEGNLSAARQKIDGADRSLQTHLLTASARQQVAKEEEAYAEKRGAFSAALRPILDCEPTMPLDNAHIEAAQKAAFGRQERLELDEAVNRHLARFRAIEDGRESKFAERLGAWQDEETKLLRAFDGNGRDEAAAGVAKALKEIEAQEAEQKRFASPTLNKTEGMRKRFEKLAALGRFRDREKELKLTLRSMTPETDDFRGFLNAVEEYAAKSPLETDVADRARLMQEKQGWIDLAVWNKNCKAWRINPVPKDPRGRLKEIDEYLKAHPNSPAKGWAGEYRAHLAAIAKQNVEIKREIDSLLDNPFVSNIWLIVDDSGKRYYTAVKPKNSDAASDAAGVTLEYYVNYEQEKKRVNMTRGRIASVNPAPQTVVAEKIRQMFLRYDPGQWDASILDAIAEIKAAKEVDPCLAAIMVRRLVKCGKEGSPGLEETLRTWMPMQDVERVDGTFCWMDPANRDEDQHRVAQEAVFHLPDARTLKGRAQTATIAKVGALAVPRPLLGWLEKSPSGEWYMQEFPGRDLAAMTDSELGIVQSGGAGRPTSWRAIGEIKNGTASVRTGASDLELRPVFANVRAKPR